MRNYVLIAVVMAIGALGGIVSGRRIQMTAMPQMVALLNGLGGGAVALIALYEFINTPAPSTVQSVTTVLSAIIGSMSFPAR